MVSRPALLEGEGEWGYRDSHGDLLMRSVSRVEILIVGDQGLKDI